MTRKDFILIASAIRETEKYAQLTADQMTVMVRIFANTLATDNDKFDIARFTKECRKA